MNYLTNYYKNLSEQLQERVNELQNKLNEGRAVIDPATGKTIIVGNDFNYGDAGKKALHYYDFDKKIKPTPQPQPGKTIVGLSPEQIDAANDPNQGGQSGKFGDSSVDMSGNKDDWMGIEPPSKTSKILPFPSKERPGGRKILPDDVIRIDQERDLDVPPMSQDLIDFFRKKYMDKQQPSIDKQQPKYELETKSNLPTNVTPIDRSKFIQKKF